MDFVSGRQVVAGEALVRFRDVPAVAELEQTMGLESVQPVGRGAAHRVRSRHLDTATLVAVLSRRPDVIYAEPNFVLRPDAIPNDPQFPSQWWLHNTQTLDADIAATGAWDISLGSREHVVAVIDGGVDYTHPDLAANIWSAPAQFTVTLGGVSITCPAGTHGLNILQMTCDPMDDVSHSHGTAMAGIIGGVGNDGRGLSGVNWTASIMPMKFMDSSGLGTVADAVNAIEAAIQIREFFSASGAANVRVLSNSYGTFFFSQAFDDQIRRANEHDMLFVAAAGNNRQDNDVGGHYPSDFEVPNVVAVAGTNSGDRFDDSYSNYGRLSVDLGAPATGLSSTARGGSYVTLTGTSNAAAITSGAAALVLSNCPHLSTADLKSALLANVDPLPTLQGITVTGGRLDVERAIRVCSGFNAAPSSIIISPADEARFTAPATVAVIVEARDADANLARVDVYANGVRIGSDATSPYGIVWEDVPAGDHTLVAVAVDDAGAATRSAPIFISVVLPPLPDTWSEGTIGFDVPSGNASFHNGTFTVTGIGADIWGRSDEFHYAYRTLNGDGAIVGRVASVQNVHAWTKAGVMIRAHQTGGSPHAFMLVSAGKGLAFQRRATTGALTTHTSGGTGAAPYWVKLARTGQTITASKSVDGVTWTVVGQDTISVGTSVLIGLAVTSHDLRQPATATFDNVTITGPTGLPIGWSATDVGSDLPVAGSASYSGGTFTVTGGGADVWGTSDEFHYVYHALNGDGAIVARVGSVENVDAWTKAGVMIRATLDARSAHAFMLVSAGKGLAFQRRTADGALTTHRTGGSGAAPYWVKLARAGRTITASTSPDGVTWTVIGQDKFSMGHSVYVGLAVTSHDRSRAARATFDNIATIPRLLPDWSADDVGAVGPAGSTVLIDGTFTVKGAGADIWGTADAFQYAYQTLDGDGEIVARVASVEPVHPWTKAGVMIRATLDPGSPHVFILLAGAKGLAFQWRNTAGGLTGNESGGTGNVAPYWVRLTRVGPAIRAAVSLDGFNWTFRGEQTISMGPSVYIGLAVTSHDSSRLATATFDGVTVR